MVSSFGATGEAPPTLFGQGAAPRGAEGILAELSGESARRGYARRRRRRMGVGLALVATFVLFGGWMVMTASRLGEAKPPEAASSARVAPRALATQGSGGGEEEPALRATSDSLPALLVSERIDDAAGQLRNEGPPGGGAPDGRRGFSGGEGEGAFAALGPQATAAPMRAGTDAGKQGARKAPANRKRATGDAGRRLAGAASARRAEDADVALLAAVISHGYGGAAQASVTPAESIAVADGGRVSAPMRPASPQSECAGLGFLERERCRWRICAGRWDADAECTTGRP